jgi:hypothetical protein
MLDGAAGSESTRDGKEDNFLVGPFCACLPSVWFLRKLRAGGVIKGKVQRVGGGEGGVRGNWEGRGGERPLEAL